MDENERRHRWREGLHGQSVRRTHAQVEAITGKRHARAASADKGYRGRKFVGTTEIYVPSRPSKQTTAHERRVAKHRFRRSAGIEGTISHLKHGVRMIRNYLKGEFEDTINSLLACAAYNFKKMLRRLEEFFAFLALAIYRLVQGHAVSDAV